MKINNRLPNMYGGYLYLINILYWPSDGGGKQYSRIDETILNLIKII